MFYSDEIIEQVRESNDIVDVVGGYVHLTKRGSNYFGLCPFHNEKSGSFSVHQGRQMFHCFGCGEGGNVFSFIMKYENMTFPEAVKYLADRAGIKLPEAKMTEEQKRNADIRSGILEVNKAAAVFFHKQLKTQNGQLAYKYFKEKRGLSDETIVKYGLGYSGRGRGVLYQYLKEKGFKDKVLKETGLFTYNDNGSVNDIFFNRAMFPIMDLQNKVIGFGGRVMGDGEPKYLNSPETKVFDKGRNLFGLNYAKLDRRPYMLICEGYMDVISMHQAGFTNTVASLGTALTGMQAHLLARYTKDVYLTYDSDGAGIKAALRAIPIFRDEGVAIHVINMQPYKDPDEFIKNLGPEEYQKRIDSAISSFTFELQVTEKKYNLSEPEQKNRFFEEVLTNIAKTYEDALERRGYLEALAARYKVELKDIEERFKKIGSRPVNYQGRVVTAEEAREIREEKARELAVKKSPAADISPDQKHLLTWLGSEPAVFERIKGIIGPEDFDEGILRNIAKMAFEQYAANGKVMPASILSRFEDPDDQNFASDVLQTDFNVEMDESSKKKALEDTVKKVKLASVERRLDAATAANDMAAFMELVAQKNPLLPGLPERSSFVLQTQVIP
ncbi:MAG: DNA primase [Lachnospiraceae bacterium]|nr:DNA primase [Lachnospiraceae bacterium]